MPRNTVDHEEKSLISTGSRRAALGTLVGMAMVGFSRTVEAKARKSKPRKKQYQVIMQPCAGGCH